MVVFCALFPAGFWLLPRCHVPALCCHMCAMRPVHSHLHVVCVSCAANAVGGGGGTSRDVSDAVVCMITLVYVVFTHLGLLAWSIVLALLYLAWDKRHLLAARAGVTFPDIQLPLKPQHATLIFAIGACPLCLSVWSPCPCPCLSVWWDSYHP